MPAVVTPRLRHVPTCICPVTPRETAVKGWPAWATAGGGAQRPWCARHGPWIGGGSPLRSKLEATASRRQLHAGGASRDNSAWRREAVWGRSRRRAAAPPTCSARCAVELRMPDAASCGSVGLSGSEGMVVRSHLHRGSPRAAGGLLPVFSAPIQVRSATVQHRRHGGVNGRGKGRGQGL